MDVIIAITRKLIPTQNDPVFTEKKCLQHNYMADVLITNQLLWQQLSAHIW